MGAERRTTGTRPGGPGGSIQPDTFLKMSIPDATKKLLEMRREKLSTQDVCPSCIQPVAEIQEPTDTAMAFRCRSCGHAWIAESPRAPKH